MLLRLTGISFLLTILSGKGTYSFQATNPITFGAATRSSLFQPKPTRSLNHGFSPSSVSNKNTIHAAASSPVIEDVVKQTGGGDGDDEEGVGAWIPLATKSGLFGLGPQRIRIMGVDLVVWHTPLDEKALKAKNKSRGKGKAKVKKEDEVTWTAQIDACTHRLAPLSQGRVDPDTKCIECPYHGWQFDSCGTVSSIPQLENETSMKTIQKAGGNVKTFPIHAVDDLMFVFLPSSLHGEMFPQSILPEQHYNILNPVEEGEDYLPMFMRTLPYSFDFLVENFMDPAHIPFAHHKLQSTRKDGVNIPMSEIVSNFTHVEATFEDITGGRKRDGYASFQRPSLYHFGEFKGVDESTGEKKRSARFPIFCVPIEAGKCRIFLYSPKLKFPSWLLHAGSNRFLNSDIWLHDTEREVVRRKDAGISDKKFAEMDYIYSSQSDLGVSIFRKWWLKNGFATSPQNTFCMSTMDELGPRSMTRQEQIDPWENHAKHCAICRNTLKKMKMGQNVCMFLAIASVVVARRIPVLGLAGIGLGLFGQNFLKRFATVIEGNPRASELADRSAAALAD